MPNKGYTAPLTPQDMIIAEARANGLSLSEIERTTGVNDATAGRHLQKPDVKAQIERIQAKVMEEAAESSADNIIHAITSYKAKDIKNDPQLREHGYKASNRMLEVMGIFPSHTPSTFIQQIIAGGDVVITQELSQLGAFLRHQWAEVAEVEDVDVSEVEEAPVGDD